MQAQTRCFIPCTYYAPEAIPEQVEDPTAPTGWRISYRQERTPHAGTIIDFAGVGSANGDGSYNTDVKAVIITSRGFIITRDLRELPSEVEAIEMAELPARPELA